MAIDALCNSCNTNFELSDELAGTEQKCPSCQAAVLIPFAPVTNSAEVAVHEPGDASGSFGGQPKELRPRNLPLALTAACIAAAVGAVVWGAITKVTGYELGYAAWGVGGIVGFACVRVGGRGADLAVICAGLSLVAILAGKAIAFSWEVSSDLDEARGEFNQQVYAETQTDAGDFAQLPVDADNSALRQFMHDHDFSIAESPDAISDAEIVSFRTFQIPRLDRFEQEQPSFETWRDSEYASWREGVEAEISLVEGVKESIGMLDLLFALFGISTAYSLVMSATKRAASPKK